MSKTEDKVIKCWWIFFHNWSRWETVKQGDLFESGSKLPIGTYKHQERECKDCGRIDVRGVTSK